MTNLTKKPQPTKIKMRHTFSKKAIITIVSAGVFLGISAFSIYQFSLINNKDHTIVQQKEEIGMLASNLEAEVYENQLLEEKNKKLQLVIQRLRDSITMLQQEIIVLRSKVVKQQNTIKSIKSRLGDIMQNYAALKNQVSGLTHQEVLDRERINQLEKEKANLRAKMEFLNRKKAKEATAISATEKAIMQRRVQEAKYLKLSNIIRQTKVKFQKISLRKKDYGRPMSKIKKKEKNWRYTIIELSLINEDHQLLLDENFVLRIVDIDTNEALSYIETNPNFPNSARDSKGVKFQYDGNLVEVTYKNNQLKQGRNYEVQIFYKADDGKEYLLSEGSKVFVRNRRVVFE